jgi:phosphoglycerol transferase MdoB-like AlkP superfamily enzyme
MFIPSLLGLLASIFKIDRNRIIKKQAFFLSFFIPILLIIGVSDIPYFQFFKSRITESAFQWMDQPQIVFEMIVGNNLNLFLLIFAIILGTLLGIISYKKLIHIKSFDNLSRSKIVGLHFFLVLFCLIGMRGNLAHPLRISDAFYSDDPTLNQAGLNTPFTLMKSFSNKVRLMNENEAYQITKSILNIENNNKSLSISRKVEYKDSISKPNVVLVLMEGMSADYLGTFGNKDGLTPNLDSLAESSLLFTNSYSAGIHTNNGIFSALYSFPALKRVRPMGIIPLIKFSGLPYAMKKYGYYNHFYSTASKSFDNLDHFILHNHFDQLTAAENYPQDKIIGPFGVSDEYMFDTALKDIDSMANGQLLFTTLLTTSNHDPYILPESFKCKFDDEDKCGVSYADWAIGQFIEKAKKKPWYDNTVFVFVADHGRVVNGSDYEMDLAFNHIPIIIHGPESLVKKGINPSFTNQIDIFPSLMHLLKLDYTNNTLGVNVFTEKRKYAYFSADDKIGCIDNEWLYIYSYNGAERLYNLKEKINKDYSKDKKDIVTSMKNYALAQTQVAEMLISKNLCSPDY